MKKFLGRMALVIGGLLLAELGWRVALLVSGQGYDKHINQELIDAALLEMGVQSLDEGKPENPERSRHTFLHPYYGYETIEGHEATAWQVDYAQKLKRELRTGAVTDPQPLSILVVGGSVARIFTDPVKNGGLEPMLKVIESGVEGLNRPVVVLGHGRESFKQPQQVMLLAYLFALGLKPDVVVNLDGFNEVGIGLLNSELDMHPLFPSQPHWTQLLGLNETTAKRNYWSEEVILVQARARRAAALAESSHLDASAILGFAARRFVAACVEDWRNASRALSRIASSNRLNPVSYGLPIEGGESDQLRLIVDSWVECSSSMNAMCSERGIVYLHVLQPTLLDDGSKSLTPEERSEGVALPAIERGVRLGYPLLRAAIPRLQARGVEVLDASMLFEDVEERVYYDLCHFNRPGTEMLGEAIGQALLQPLTDQAIRAELRQQRGLSERKR